MLDITHQNFEAELINASMQQPVLLDIWAPWCGPCKTLGPVLERLETAYAGRFSLAKLNSDEQPEIASQLSQMFGVRSIPFCVLFKGGQPVDGFVGALPEGEVRKFLDKHVPSEAELAAEEDALAAEELLAEGDTTAARQAYEPVASKALLDPRLQAAGRWLEACETAPKARPVDTLQAAIAANRRDFEARYELAQRHFAAGRFTEAMDELLEIVMRDKGWNDEAARKSYVAILEIMTRPAPVKAEAAAPKGTLEVAGKVTTKPSDPVVDAYRRKLSMALF